MEAESPVCLRRSSLTSSMSDEEDDGFMEILDDEEMKVEGQPCPALGSASGLVGWRQASFLLAALRRVVAAGQSPSYLHRVIRNHPARVRQMHAAPSSLSYRKVWREGSSPGHI